MAVYNIYVIDDDPIYQFSFKSLLGLLNQSFNVQQFHNGEEAIEALKECDKSKICFPDFIFLDLNMPVMDGWNFLDEFREHFSESNNLPRIYIVSSSLHHEDLLRSEAYPIVQEYLVKPISRIKLSRLFEPAEID